MSNKVSVLTVYLEEPIERYMADELSLAIGKLKKVGRVEIGHSYSVVYRDSPGNQLQRAFEALLIDLGVLKDPGK